MKLHESKSCYMKIVEVDHPFLPQEAYTGPGRGQYTMVGGHPQIHNVVLELLKLDIVWRVTCAKGYFLVMVSEPHRWGEVDGPIQRIIGLAIDTESGDAK